MAEFPKNFAQAFDLSTLAVKRESESTYLGLVLDRSNLVTEVLPASAEKVFIVVAWSPRSPQTLSLIKTMAQLEELSEGSWSLATLNVDEQPEVAQAFSITAIPLTTAIIGGQLVPLFESIPPQADIEKTITRLFQLATEQGLLSGGVDESHQAEGQEGEGAEEKLEPEESEAMAALNSGDFSAAQDAYRRWVARDPANQMAKSALAQVDLLIRIGAADFDSSLKEADSKPSDVTAAMLAADLQLSVGDYLGAFDRLINFVANNSEPEKITAKDHLIKLFDLIDPTDPIVTNARRKLASALF
jgi:putative thioredoxin